MEQNYLVRLKVKNLNDISHCIVLQYNLRLKIDCIF